MTTWTQFFPFLTTTYLHVDIFNPEGGQKWHFLDHLPPLLELNEYNVFFFVKMLQRLGIHDLALNACFLHSLFLMLQYFVENPP